MNDMEHEDGALVYLPAGARLLQFEKGKKLPIRYYHVQKPASVLLLHGDIKYCDVIYGGERWSVKTTDIYPMRS